ncbi:MAG: Xaa-Pro peptidase family protein [Anaerolineae bacterium]|nr:Xaa-Pro peptidase family protein [Anaerolineae bacterium]MDW8099177.1 Xaa-Pro peptidase family protein [Anaerolineae bacterium]
MLDLGRVQSLLTEAGLGGWLLFDFHGMNPIARRVVGLPAQGVFSRRWAYWIPPRGEPAWIIPRLEAGHFQAPLPGRILTYVSWQDWLDRLRSLLHGVGQVAMEYSPQGAIPYVSRVDAGTIEMVRGLGVEVVSSADLVQAVEACWTAEQLAGHRRSAAALLAIKDMAFQHIAQALGKGQMVCEHEVQQFILQQCADRGLIGAGAIVAVNAHSSNPHYFPSPDRPTPVRSGDWVLIDLWAKEERPDAVYADITWVAYAGVEPPKLHQDIFDIVRAARDAAVRFVQQGIRAGRPVYGYEVDDVARGIITYANYGEYFIHRTGHSIGVEAHGNGVNIDNLETQDRRRLIPGVGFSIEPGIYLPEFGVRLEIDMYVGERDAEVTTLPLQDEIVRLL